MSPAEIVADFRKRYAGTYVYVEEPATKDRSLFFIDRIDDTSDKLGVIHLSSNEVGKIRLNFGSAHTLHFEPVPVGVFQHGPDAHFCRRRPQRQWRRGICADNTHIARTPSLITQETTRLTFDLVADAFKRQTFGLKESLGMLAKGRYRSVALYDNFSLSLPLTEAKDQGYLLFFWDLPVAKIKQDGTVSQVLEAAFAAQITKVIGG